MTLGRAVGGADTKPYQVRKDAFFQVHARQGTFSAEQSDAILRRAARTREGLEATLQRSDLAKTTLAIYLADDPDEAPEGAADAIRLLCTPDTPAGALEGEVLDRLLRASCGLRAPHAAFLVDGLLGHFAGMRGEVDLDAISADLAQKKRRDELPRVAAAMSGGRGQDPATLRALATSFVTFVLTTKGPAAFQTFVRDFDPTHPEESTRGAYAVSLGSLEESWLDAIRDTRPAMGIGALIGRSLRYLRPYAKQQVLILVLMGVGVVFEQVVLPLSQKYLIDVAIGKGQVALVFELLTGLLVLFALQGAATLAKDYVSARTGARVMSSLRARLFEHLQALSMGYHGRSQVGDLMSRFSTDMENVERALTQGVLAFVQAVGGIFVGLLTMFGLEWKLSLASIATWIVFVLGPGLIGPRAARASFARQDDVGRVSSAVQENLVGQAVIKVFGLEKEAIRRFAGHLDHLLESETRLGFLSSLFGMAASLSNAFVQVVTLGIGGYLVIHKEMTLGSLVAFLGLQAGVIGPILQLSQVLSEMQQATGGLQRVEEVLNEVPEVADAPGARAMAPFEREIRFEHVSFSHRKGEPTLRDVDLTLPRGGWYALVGASGCGKSTTMSLLMRLFDPSEGRVLIDGVDLRELSQASVRAQMGVVLQDSFLFNLSIRENIRYGRLDASDADVERAALEAEIHAGILALPEGYDTVVGERGGRLSGGQRQRIGIARALVRNPRILLLDEATSALDPQTEAQLNATLQRVGKARTVIAVTHRLDSAKIADRIFVFDRGQLLEQGTHADLVRADGIYAQLWQQQHGAAGEVEARLLARAPLFQGLSPAEVTALARLVVTERFRPGETILREGEAGDKLYILVQGRVEVTATGPAGTRQRLAELHPGDCFGEVALLRSAPRIASVASLTHASALTLARAPFLALLETNPELRAAFEASMRSRRPAAAHALA